MYVDRRQALRKGALAGALERVCESFEFRMVAYVSTPYKPDARPYIERFYNPRRRHSTIGHLSPMEFEQNAASA